MKIRKQIAVMLIGGMILCSNMEVLAVQQNEIEVNNCIASQEVAVEKLTDKYHITEEEVMNLDENVNVALEKQGMIKNSFEGNLEKKVIPVSENLQLELSIQKDDALTKGVRQGTVTSNARIKNALGMTLITLTSVGVFQYNGSTCVPIDAYGSYVANFWNVTNTGTSLGRKAYTTWARNSFSGKVGIGIDQISVTLQSFNMSCKMTCDANAKYSAVWS